MKLRQGRIVRATAAVTGMVLVLGGANAVAAEQATDKGAVTQAGRAVFTDAEIEVLDGLLLGVGPFAEKIGSDVAAVIPAERYDDYVQEATAFREDLVAARPREVRAALSQIASGNVNRVEQGISAIGETLIEYGQEVTQEAVDRGELDESVIAAITDPAGTVTPNVCTPLTFCAVALVVYAAVAVHNTAAVTALAAVVIGAWTWCGVTSGCSAATEVAGVQADDRVRYERLVSHVARSAAAAVDAPAVERVPVHGLRGTSQR